MHIRSFTFATLRQALSDGWRLANATRAVSVGYSILFVAGGVAIMGGLLASGRAPFVLAAAGGFMLVGPVILAGYFGIAQTSDAGKPVTAGAVVAGFGGAARALWALAAVRPSSNL